MNCDDKENQNNGESQLTIVFNVIFKMTKYLDRKAS